MIPKLLALAIWAVVTTLVRAIIAFGCLLHGERGINFGAVIHPWNCDIQDVYGRVDGSWFARNAKGGRRPFFFFFLRPLLWLPIWGVLTGLKFLFHKTYFELIEIGVKIIGYIAMALGRFALAHLAAVVIICGFIGLILGIRFALRRAREAKLRAWHNPEYRARMERESRERMEAERRAALDTYDRLGSLLACKPNLTPALSALPKERRTIHLRYLELKRKVCRPWAMS